MDLNEARGRLEGIVVRARLAWPGATARHVEAAVERMLKGLTTDDDCARLAAEIREVRAAEGWPGKLPSWLWFDERLYAIASELECVPAVVRTSPADRARLRERV